jgi:hypothetical protein
MGVLPIPFRLFSDVVEFASSKISLRFVWGYFYGVVGAQMEYVTHNDMFTSMASWAKADPLSGNPPQPKLRS